LCELRRAQIEAQNRERLRQLALFELHDDSRPVTERTAADRYQQPSLLDLALQNG
jgi:hypothetical protein